MKCRSSGSRMAPRLLPALRVSSRPPALKVISHGSSLRTRTVSAPLVRLACSASTARSTSGASSRTSKTGAAGTDPAKCTTRTRITSGIGDDRSTRSTGPSIVYPRWVMGLTGARIRSERASAVTSCAAVA